MHQPTERVLAILEYVAAGPDDCRLSALSRALDIPKSTLLPILQTLAARRYLAQDAGGGYGPGPALFSLGASLSDTASPRQPVRQQLELLAAETGETCYFGVREGGSVLYLERADADRPLRMRLTVRRRLPAYATGIGKALLLDCTAADLRALYPNGLTPLTPHTRTDLDALAAELAESRRQGYTAEIEESTEQVRCYGAPVRVRGEIAAAVSVAFPVFRHDPARGNALVDALLRTARSLGQLFETTGTRPEQI